jgi:hypothetical protein
MKRRSYKAAYETAVTFILEKQKVILLKNKQIKDLEAIVKELKISLLAEKSAVKEAQNKGLDNWNNGYEIAYKQGMEAQRLLTEP